MSSLIHLCSIAELPTGRGKRFELDDGREIALFHVKGKVYAVDNFCPHQRFPRLHDGDIWEGAVTCPMHGWRFDLDTGKCISGGNSRLTTYDVVVKDEQVYIDAHEPTPKWMEG